jgi:hypothetical protein
MSPDPNPNRQPKGVPVGVQFANKVNPESTIELVEEAGPIDASSFMNERVEELRRHGYVSATTAPSMVDPRSSAHRKEWWGWGVALRKVDGESSYKWADALGLVET